MRAKETRSFVQFLFLKKNLRFNKSAALMQLKIVNPAIDERTVFNRTPAKLYVCQNYIILDPIPLARSWYGC